MRSFKTFQSSCKNVPTCISRAIMIMIMFLLVSTHMFINAQATLSLQGILKKANGIALEDDTYPITFKIYVVDSTQVKWMETQPEVEVISGIYSVILGKVTPLNLPFDKDYELGISIGSQEMRPRVRLTSAPYALALRGSSNQFPSAGQVLADEIKVAQGVLASGGAPGTNGVDKNGYAFTGNSGDNDSGLFSTQDGETSIYINNVEKVEVNSNGANVQGTLGANQVNVYNNGVINYSSDQGSFSGWRLADVDDLQSHDGWQQYSPSGQNTGWNNPDASLVLPCLCGGGTFVGNILQPSVNTQVLKKMFNITGSWSQMKVKFRYYFIDSWGFGGGDMAFAGFSPDAAGSQFKVGWAFMGQYLQANGNFNNTTAVNATNIGSSNSSYSDYWMDVEMTARRDGNLSNFWVFIGAAVDEGASNEHYAVGPIEIWVR